ncbi:MAG: hypothetical protein AAGD25_13500 [Cyanobacteria bacterium P01_F01_bin.150]
MKKEATFENYEAGKETIQIFLSPKPQPEDVADDKTTWRMWLLTDARFKLWKSYQGFAPQKFNLGYDPESEAWELKIPEEYKTEGPLHVVVECPVEEITITKIPTADIPTDHAPVDSTFVPTEPGNGGFPDHDKQIQSILDEINAARKDTSYRRNVVELVEKLDKLRKQNEEDKKKGLPPEEREGLTPEEVDFYLNQYENLHDHDLVLDPKLCKAAQWQAEYCANTLKTLTHDGPTGPMHRYGDRIRLFGFVGSIGAEAGAFSSGTPVDTCRGWLQGTSHFRPFFWRAGQIKPYIGLGIAKGPNTIKGKTYEGTYAFAVFGAPPNWTAPELKGPEPIEIENIKERLGIE